MGRRGKSSNKYKIQTDKEETSKVYVYFSSLNYLYITAIMEQIQWYRKTGRRGKSTNKYTIQTDKEETSMIYEFLSSLNYLYITAFMEEIQWCRKMEGREK